MYFAGGHQFQVLARLEVDRRARVLPLDQLSLHTATPSAVIFWDFGSRLRAEMEVVTSLFANELSVYKQ